MRDRAEVLRAIQADDLTIGQISDCTGIAKGTVEILLHELKQARLAAITVDKQWRGFERGRDFGGYAK